ncbi:MAG TPA: hypothetical protein VIX80_07765, partial [Candidatus Kapabacteria bacterium]
KKNTPDGTVTTVLSRNENLEGVIEVVVKSGLSDDDAVESNVELTVEAMVMEVTKEWQAANTDGSISIALHMVNGSKEITFTPDFSIKGFERVIDTVLEKTDEFVHPFNRLSNETSAYFSVTLEREGYNQYTDIGLQILKASNASVSNGAFDERESATRVLFTDNDTNSYRLFFKGGLANPDRSNTTRLSIQEMRGVKQTVAAAITPSGKITLAPEESVDLRLRFKDTRSAALSGLIGVGELSLKVVGLSDEIAIPVRF